MNDLVDKRYVNQQVCPYTSKGFFRICYFTKKKFFIDKIGFIKHQFKALSSGIGTKIILKITTNER